MQILLDTHIALWALADDRRLTAAARVAIADPDNSVMVSAASVWEIAIKRALGRSRIPFDATAAIGYFKQAGYRLLDIRAEHTAAVETLPKLLGDPFDRILVAQAITEPLRLMTHDKALAAYSDTIILV
ncbi:MAG: type II toxin-antitoxin system VapC family toxin [Xanthomonadales bacterium]|nr:type II toxin-antitoxin system VapC family toxin [Xanthomonadales bacterium]